MHVGFGGGKTVEGSGSCLPEASTVMMLSLSLAYLLLSIVVLCLHMPFLHKDPPFEVIFVRSQALYLRFDLYSGVQISRWQIMGPWKYQVSHQKVSLQLERAHTMSRELIQR